MDLDTGAVVAVTLREADKGDTTTLDRTQCEPGAAVAELVGREAVLHPDVKSKVNIKGIEEMVADNPGKEYPRCRFLKDRRPLNSVLPTA